MEVVQRLGVSERDLIVLCEAVVSVVSEGLSKGSFPKVKTIAKRLTPPQAPPPAPTPVPTPVPEQTQTSPQTPEMPQTITFTLPTGREVVGARWKKDDTVLDWMKTLLEGNIDAYLLHETNTFSLGLFSGDMCINKRSQRHTKLSELIPDRVDEIVCSASVLTSDLGLSGNMDEDHTPEMEQETCAICLGDNIAEVPGDHIATLECRHEFHYLCLKELAHNSNRCPVCRGESNILYSYHPYESVEARSVERTFWIGYWVE